MVYTINKQTRLLGKQIQIRVCSMGRVGQSILWVTSVVVFVFICSCCCRFIQLSKCLNYGRPKAHNTSVKFATISLYFFYILHYNRTIHYFFQGTWTELPTMSNKRADFSAAVVGGKIVVVGGIGMHVYFSD